MSHPVIKLYGCTITSHVNILNMFCIMLQPFTFGGFWYILETMGSWLEVTIYILLVKQFLAELKDHSTNLKHTGQFTNRDKFHSAFENGRVISSVTLQKLNKQVMMPESYRLVLRYYKVITEKLRFKLRMWRLKDVGIYQAGTDIELHYGKCSTQCF